SDLMTYERLLLDKLFASKKQIKISSLKQTFYKDLALVKKALEQEGQDRGFFSQAPSKIVTKYLVAGIILLCIGIFGAIMLAASNNFYSWIQGLAIGLIIPSIALVIAASHMPQKTAKGR